MNKFFKRALAALTVLACAVSASAQGIPMAPTDPEVRVGKLENGLTYYIRHNEMPKGQADFFIAQKVGSILEEEQQRGLAHFLEHMCFNGTENFPGTGLRDWLETIGVRFGQNLNAYTSIDETVYNISSVPVDRTGVQDSCLLILHDWADGLLLDPKDIDDERGVIHEEWRQSNVGQMRILTDLLPKIYPGSKYGERLPIGTMEVVDNFPPQVLRDYYETWYRPDNQAVIVVGDIDPDYIEGKIKEIFGGIKMPENPKERVYEGVPDNEGTIYAIGADKEMQAPVSMIAFKMKEQMLPRQFRGTVAFFGVDYLQTMINMMMNQRMREFAAKPDASFVSAGVDLGEYFISSTKDALSMQVQGKGGDIVKPTADAYRELLRAIRGGFNVSEYELAKADYLAKMQKAYDERKATTNTQYAREYARNFTDGDPIPGIEIENQMAQMLAQQVTLDQINAMLPELIGPDNRIVLIMLPEKEGITIPTESEVAAALQAVEAENIEPLAETLKEEPLVPELPRAQKAVKTAPAAQWGEGATEITYANGARIIVKPTKFKEGSISFSAVANGGLSAVDYPVPTVLFLDDAMSVSGLGTYNNVELKKYLRPTNTSMGASISDINRMLNGTTTRANLKVLMELIYMTFRDYTITEDDFAAKLGKQMSELEHNASNPQIVWITDVYKNLWRSPYRRYASAEDIKDANREETLSLVHTMFANPGDFTFVFVGDLDVAELTELADTYIGGIAAPRIAGVPLVINPDFEITPGVDTVINTMEMQQPMTWVMDVYTAAVPYTAKNRMLAQIGAQVLSARLINKIREEMGAVYSISASGGLARLNKTNFTLQIPFPMKPELQDEVLAEIARLTDALATEVTTDELQPRKEFMLKEFKESQELNSDWAGTIIGTAMNGVNTWENYEATLQAITTEDVQNFFKEVLGQNNHRIIILKPATPAAE